MQEAGRFAQIVNDPNWLADRFDDARDQVQFVYAPRAVHDAVVFLSDEYLPPDGERKIIARSEIAALSCDHAPLHFIFHSAFCCSTLLARTFDLPGQSMGLKEPHLLQDIVGYGIRGASSEQRDDALAMALALLARPFGTDEAVIVKPSCVVNSLAAPILADRFAARALFLYAPLRIFLGSIARKGITGRLWARELFTTLRKSGLADLGYSDDELFGQTDLQIAGLAWLAQHMHFTELANSVEPGRVRMLDSESLIAQPEAALAALSALFGIHLTSEQIAAIVQGPAFTSHSKFGGNYDAGQREKDLTDGASLYADEIEKVAIWVETVAQGLNAQLGSINPLLG